MSRRKHFHPAHEPLRDDASLELQTSRVTGPLSFLNPTQAHFQHISAIQGPDDNNDPTTSKQTGPESFRFKWTSRNNRKGRHALLVPKPGSTTAPSAQPDASRPTTHPKSVAKGVWRMLTTFPVWDVSYLVAVIFTLGSVVWVINACFVFLPSIAPQSEFDQEVLYGGGITAFVGATIFEVGSVLLMLEAINEHREGCFGWAVQQVVKDWRGDEANDTTKATGVKIVPGQCSHHHKNRHNLVGSPAASSNKDADSNAVNTDNKSEPTRSWIWYPSLHDLNTHFLHELGFLACSAQLFGASVFWISGVTALPGTLNTLSAPLAAGIYWTPQVVGGTGFIVSGVLFMLETQDRWWKPAVHVLGWHIGFWNLIGGIGFTLSAAFGYDAAAWAQEQAGASTFWASWAFLLGSGLQWYESLDKWPVREVESKEVLGKESKEGQQ